MVRRRCIRYSNRWERMFEILLDYKFYQVRQTLGIWLKSRELEILRWDLLCYTINIISWRRGRALVQRCSTVFWTVLKIVRFLSDAFRNVGLPYSSLLKCKEFSVLAITSIIPKLLAAWNGRNCMEF